MPQMFQNPLSQIGNWVFGAHAEQEHPDRGPEVPESPPPEEVDRKRARTDDEIEETGSSKKARVRGGSPLTHTVRRTGQPAQGLTLTDHSGHQEVATTGVKNRMNKVARSGHRPMNTLNVNPHETSTKITKGERLLNSVPGQQQRRRAKARSDQLHVARSSNTTIVPAKHPHGQGFWNEPVASVPKRQKTENHIEPLEEDVIKYDTQSEHEGEYVAGGDVAAVNGKRVSRSTLSDGMSASESSGVPRFGAQEVNEAYKYTAPGPQKKARKPRLSSQNSQQSSGRSSPTMNAPKDRAIALGRPREQSVIEIPDDDDSQQRSTKLAMKKMAAASGDPRISEQGAPRLRADVVDHDGSTHSAYPRSSQRSGVNSSRHEENSQLCKDESAGLLRPNRQNAQRHTDKIPKPSAINGNSALLQQQRSDSSSGRVSIDGPASVVSKSKSRSLSPNAPLNPRPFRRYIDRVEPDADTRNRFKRDGLALQYLKANESQQGSMPPPPPPATQKHRSAEESVNTEDELQGDTTVGSGRVRHVSPSKPPASRPRLKGMSNGQPRLADDARSRDTMSVEFAGSKKEERRTGNRLVKRNVFNTEHKFSIVAIYCRGCCQQHPKALELIWDPEDMLFYVRLAGDCLRLPVKDELFTIDPAKVQSVTVSDDSSRTIVRSAVTENSNGKILIESASLDEAEELQFTLLADNRIQRKRIDQLVLDKQFEHLIEEALLDRKKYLENMKSLRETQDFALMEDRRASRATVSEIADTVQQSRQQPSRASLMRSRELPSVNNEIFEPQNQSNIVSRYFDHEPRRSTRQSQPVKTKTLTPPPPEPVRWTEQNRPKRWASSVVYPAQGAKRVTVDFDDLERLDEGQFFNDNIISFALRQIQEDMSPETRKSVHFFSTFFYSSLTSKTTSKGINYDAVKRWTKNVDLFNYPFVVIPINIELHWFVMIIVNLPNVERRLLGDEDEADPRADNNIEAMEELSIKDAGEQAAGRDIFTFDNNNKVQSSPLSTRSNTPEALALLDAENNPSMKTKAKARAKNPPLRKADPNKPTIVTLDSFGSTHSKEVRLLKLYLSEEAREKRSMDLDPSDQSLISGLTAKGIPEQQNFCDCGVYVVGYIQEFAKDPRKFVNKIFSREMDKKQDFASFDPSAKRAEVRDALLGLYEEQTEERRRAKEAKLGKSTSSAAAIPARSLSKPEMTPSDKPSRSSSPRKTLAAESKGEDLPNLKSDLADVSAEHEMDELELSMPHALLNVTPGLRARVMIPALREALPNAKTDSNGLPSAHETSDMTMADSSIAETNHEQQSLAQRSSPPMDSATSSSPSEQPALNLPTSAGDIQHRKRRPTTPSRQMSAGSARHSEDSDSESSSTGSNIVVSSPAKPSPQDHEYSILGPLKDDVDTILSLNRSPNNNSTIRHISDGSHHVNAASAAQHSDHYSSKDAKDVVRRSTAQQHEYANSAASSFDARKTRTSPRSSRTGGAHLEFDD